MLGGNVVLHSPWPAPCKTTAKRARGGRELHVKPGLSWWHVSLHAPTAWPGLILSFRPITPSLLACRGAKRWLAAYQMMDCISSLRRFIADWPMIARATSPETPRLSGPTTSSVQPAALPQDAQSMESNDFSPHTTACGQGTPLALTFLSVHLWCYICRMESSKASRCHRSTCERVWDRNSPAPPFRHTSRHQHPRPHEEKMIVLRTLHRLFIVGS